MKVIIFGATGMVGQATVRECLQNPKVELVLSIGRNSIGSTLNSQVLTPATSASVRHRPEKMNLITLALPMTLPSQLGRPWPA
jgi:dihydrodipicolinate reductase